MNIQKILVPVDGSTASFEAFMWACELASRFQAQVHMVYMVDARKQVAGAGRVPIGIESGEKEPSLHQLTELAGFFGTTADYLLKGEEK